LIGGSLQQLQPFASLPIVIVQSEDCPQAWLAVKNLPYASPHPVSLFACNIVATVSKREQECE
jgi:hypothetical protein